MQPKVLCLLFVALVATSVTAGIVDDVLNGVKKTADGVEGAVNNVVQNGQKSSNNSSNSSNALRNIKVPRISIPSSPNIAQIPDVAKGVEAAQKLLATNLNSAGNLADTLTNLITAALKGTQPLADLLNVFSQILKAFSQVAAGNPLEAGLLILNSGLELARSMLRVVIHVVIPIAINTIGMN
ncbi:hypothetical protein QLX08_006779 [Tetragonisca angustula]|uniref:Uncharacterized protein n=1 Tax=Tetragonisca angustula TaxID=166442 RepID=A0AAW0ZRX0_9HYME